MKYKVGDIIKIKEDIFIWGDFKGFLKNLNPPYVITIKNVLDDCYEVEENPKFAVSATWTESHIEGLYIEPEPIENRFEILDL